jgi:hypothetical protein
MRRLVCTSLVTAAAAAALLPISATAAPPGLRVSPASTARGTVVTFTGSGCPAGDTVFLISRLFPGHAYGIGAISTRVRASGHFLRRFGIRATTPRRRYTITARCGGANLGVAVHLRVR